MRFTASGVEDFPIMNKLHEFMNSFVKQYDNEVLYYGGTMCYIDEEVDSGEPRDDAIDMYMTHIREGNCIFYAEVQLTERAHDSDIFQKFLERFVSAYDSVKVSKLYEHVVEFKPVFITTLCVKHFCVHNDVESTLKFWLSDYFGRDAKYVFSHIDSATVKVCIDSDGFKMSSTDGMQETLDELASCLFENYFSLIGFDMVCNVVGTNMNRSSLC